MTARRRAFSVLALVLTLTAGACSGDTLAPSAALAPATPGPPTAPRRTLAVAPAPEAVQTEYLEDRTLHLSSRPAPVVLERAPHPALQGTLAPLVAPSPDGNLLAYTTYTETVSLDPSRPPSAQGVAPGDVLGTPSVRLHDLRTGAERVLATGAYSAAWRPDGALAFVLGSETAYRAGATYLGEVVVRPPGAVTGGSGSGGSGSGGIGGADAADEPWTFAEGRYVVAGWAGRRLLLYHETGNESFDLEIADGPGDVRTLLPGASLVALSPDGERAAVATSANGRASEVEILNLATGDLVAIVPTTGHTSLVYGGSWVGSRLVARGGDDDGPLVAVFDVGAGGRDARLTQVLRVDARLPYGLAEPRLDPGDTNRLTAWSFVPGGPSGGSYVLVRCDLMGGSCVSGPPIRAKVVRLYGGAAR